MCEGRFIGWLFTRCDTSKYEIFFLCKIGNLKLILNVFILHFYPLIGIIPIEGWIINSWVAQIRYRYLACRLECFCVINLISWVLAKALFVACASVINIKYWQRQSIDQWCFHLFTEHFCCLSSFLYIFQTHNQIVLAFQFRV